MKISVITATFNSARTIEGAVHSVLAQSLPEGWQLEYVVIDGGSLDGTLDVLRSFADQIDVLISEPDGGLYDALNKGISVSSGDVVGFLHSDDFFYDQFTLQRIATAFDAAPVSLTYGDLQYVKSTDPEVVVRNWRAGSFIPEKLSRGWMPPHPTLYARKSLYEDVGVFNTRYRISADYENILRLFSAPELRVAYIPEVLVRMRTGGVSNRSLKNVWRKSAEDLHAMRAHGIGGLGTLAWKNLSKIGQLWAL